MREYAIGQRIAGIGVEVHRVVGPGLLETVYVADIRPGYLLNFGAVLMKQGLSRIDKRLEANC